MARTAVKAGWKALEKVLNEILSQTESYRPLEGSGIRIEDVAGGKLISVSPDSTSNTDSSQNQAGTGGPPLLINSEKLVGMKWEDITVIDPSTCAQSTITVLRRTDDLNDSIVINYKYYYWASPQPAGAPQ